MKAFPLLVLLVLPGFGLLAQNFPKDSLMATQAASLQKDVIAPLQNPSEARPGGYKFENGTATVFEGELPPEQSAAVVLAGETTPGAGKGDFSVAKTLQGTPRWVGAWFYVGADDNVKSVGVQFHEKSGEYLSYTWPADFTGWKWLEVEINENTFTKSKQESANGILDDVVDRVSIIWWTHGAGPTKIGVTQLVTAGD